MVKDAQTQNPVEISDKIYDDGYLRVEHDNYFVSCGGKVLKLPRSEFLIVSRMARTPERIVPSKELWSYTWGKHKLFNPTSLHVYMYRLRKKLMPYGLNIETMVNVGYRLIPRK